MTTDQNIARVVLAFFYLVAGITHLRSPSFFMPVMPSWVPAPQAVIVATGWCEMIGAIALMTGRFRRAAGIMLALYAACVFPANIKHAIDDLSAGTGLGWWYHGPRLLAQPLIVWWALFAGDVTHWPFRRRLDSTQAD